MITVSQLKDICNYTEMKYGPNTKVGIAISGSDGYLESLDFCWGFKFDNDGILYLTNQKCGGNIMAIDKNISIQVKQQSVDPVYCSNCVHKNVCKFEDEYSQMNDRICAISKEHENLYGFRFLEFPSPICKFFNNVEKEKNDESISIASKYPNILDELAKRDPLYDSITSTCSLGKSLKWGD